MYLYHFQLNKCRQDYLFGFSLLVLIASIVIADPESNLDINKEIPELNVLSILNDKESWRKDKSDSRQWRKPKDNPASNVRWGAISIYEESRLLPPGLTPSENEVDTMIDSRDAAPQFKLSF